MEVPKELLIMWLYLFDIYLIKDENEGIKKLHSYYLENNNNKLHNLLI